MDFAPCLKKTKFFLIVSLVLFAVPTTHAGGRDMSGRWGLGVSNIGPGLFPGLSLDWQMSQVGSTQFLLGIDTATGSNHLLLGARYNRNLFIEESLHFSINFGGGLQSTAANGSGFFIDTGFENKFFLQNLPNLAFSAGGGIRLITGGSMQFKTIAIFGMHYYF